MAKFDTMVRKVSAVGLGLVLASCAGAGSLPEVDPGPQAPSISSISPESGRAGIAYPIEIVVTGKGFAPSGNVIHFGDLQVGPVASTQGGTRIAFLAPKHNAPSGGAAPMPLLPGRYPITVTSAGQTSPAVVFELVRDEAILD